MIIKEITWTEKLFYFIWIVPIWVNIIKTSFCITVFFLFKLISNSLLKRGLDEKLHKYITNLKVILIYIVYECQIYTKNKYNKNLYKLLCNDFKFKNKSNTGKRHAYKNSHTYYHREDWSKSQYKEHWKMTSIIKNYLCTKQNNGSYICCWILNSLY